jgi:putative transposase
MEDLQAFISTTRDAREVKRALAVQNTLAGRPRAEVAAELGYTVAFVDKWRWRYAREGVDGLRIGYTGSKGYLTGPQKQEVVTWLQAQRMWDVRTLQHHVEGTYGIRYKSPKSYYALMNEARLSWKKTQDDQPNADADQVAVIRQAIQKKRAPRQARF